MQNISFKRHRFPPEVIRHAVWLYARFTLSYRDVEDLLAERGLDISYETVRRWFLKFGEPIACNLRRTQPTPSDYWHLDEKAIVIRGKRHWLWRAVDNEGEFLDFLVQRQRNARAALKLMRKLLKKQGNTRDRPNPRHCQSFELVFVTGRRSFGFHQGQRSAYRSDKAGTMAASSAAASNQFPPCNTGGVHT